MSVAKRAPGVSPRQFERKMLVGIFLIFLLILPVLLVAGYSLRKLAVEQNDVVAVRAQELILAERLNSALNVQFATMPVYLLSGDERLLTRFQEAHIDFKRVHDELAALVASAADRKVLREIVARESRLFDLSERAVKMKREGKTAQQIHAMYQKLPRSGPNPLETLAEFTERKAAEFEQAKREDAAVTSRITLILGIAGLLSMLLAVAVAALMVRETQRKRQQDQRAELSLEETNRLSLARKDAVEVVAHDLKNPLAALKLSVQLAFKQLDRGLLTEDVLRKRLQSLLTTTEAMEALIRSLLDHAKIESGHMVLQRSTCDVRKLLQELVDLWQNLAAKKELTLLAEFRGGPWDAVCDGVRLRQVFSNLIGNAAKFTPAGGHIQIRASAHGGQFEFEVEDSGSGIAPEDLSRIFDRFWQARSTEGQGTGLGLAIVKAIVTAHGGRIQVESEIGRGTRFHFSVPAVPPEEVIQRSEVENATT